MVFSTFRLEVESLFVVVEVCKGHHLPIRVCRFRRNRSSQGLVTRRFVSAVVVEGKQRCIHGERSQKLIGNKQKPIENNGQKVSQGFSSQVSNKMSMIQIIFSTHI